VGPFGVAVVDGRAVRGVESEDAVNNVLCEVWSVVEDGASLVETLLPGMAIHGFVISADRVPLPPALLPSTICT